MKGEKKEMWLALGAAAVLSAIFNVIWTLCRKDARWFRFLSLAFTALTLCAFYADGAGRVIREDWAGLMDTMPAINTVLWVCTGASILINAISLFPKKQ